MSIFAVIKYPISNCPTVEELAALPKDLFDTWKISVHWSDTDVVDPNYISYWYRAGNSQAKSCRKHDIEMLRGIIQESDE
jgi:hypothetical protein